MTTRFKSHPDGRWAYLLVPRSGSPVWVIRDVGGRHVVEVAESYWTTPHDEDGAAPGWSDAELVTR